ncbi:TSUP family transporter [Paracoccus pacificus]|uniref:Probable membrane transporter protein n=1 Tax=Paracoccus pacificus TaxID=1463598 RepID=A0ABW4R4A4_9RHOB
MFEISLTFVILLIGAAFFAGIIDSIAGGGGLITIPALMLAGLSPLEAISINKVQAVFGASSAAYSYAKAGHVDLRRQLPAALLAFGGGVAGAILISYLPSEWLRGVLPWILIAIAGYFAFKRGLGDVDGQRRISPAVFSATIVPLVGFYDGFFGPGAGSFYMLGFVSLAGYGLLKATAHSKLLNLASNFGGLVIFAATGAPVWGLGLVMAVAQTAGAMLGARLAMRVGARVIRPLLVLTSVALALRLLWQNYG